ncbi:putative Lysophospholipid acyltransferase LPEAT1 [Blattamonas nauphoetae]|uniref:Lysophospholipid acyltransferase LPEAT1 n=1 Tax=Blattamonas nauphoetae TaxID=2049346 RepID=A0ABQ9XM29_9EUKA|nr:putative Lysophospholipid acyltransferase LPEAT1 [Blattamonas nauphoetae]
MFRWFNHTILRLGKPDDDLIKNMEEHQGLRCYVHDWKPRNFWTYFRLFILPGPIIILLRIVIFAFLYLLNFLWQRLVFIGVKDFTNPASSFRRTLSVKGCTFLSALTFYAIGMFPKVVDHSKDRPRSKNPQDLPRYEKDQPWVLVGNHSSFMDVTAVSGAFSFPSTMAKDAFMKAPLVGFILRCSRSIFQVRQKPHEKDKPNPTIVEMERRIKHPEPGEYTLCMFPEGTTGNGKYITRYRTGAFQFGEPVRPFAIRYMSPHCGTTWEINGFVSGFVELASQFYTRMQVDILDLYVPSEEEKADPQLFADNVGALTAKTLGIPYRRDVDFRTKMVALDLVFHGLKWEDALVRLDDIEKDRR